MKTCKQIAAEWGMSVRTLTNLCSNQKIPGAVKAGKSWQIPDYVRAQAEYYYVDKTLMIRDFLDRKPLVSLFTRPRRFGKTMNMDMLRVFLKSPIMIQAFISGIRPSGSVARNTQSIRENIL